MNGIPATMLILSWPLVAAAATPYSVQLETRHCTVWTTKDRTLAARVGRAAEDLYADFLQTLSPNRQLTPPDTKFPIVCLDKPVTDPHGKDKDRLPPGQDSWPDLIAVTVDTTPGPLNRTTGRVRHQLAAHLLTTTLGASRAAHLPAWCRRGLPSYFEGTGGLRLNGTVRLMRLGIIESVYARHPIPDLEELISPPAEAETPAQLLTSYALSWSLCHFLLHGAGGQYRKGFLQFLYAERPSGRADPTHALFAGTVGDAQVIQPEWIKHIYLVSRAGDKQLAATLRPIGSQPHRERSETERRLQPKVPAAASVVTALAPASRTKASEVWNVLREAHPLTADGRARTLAAKLRPDDETAAALCSTLKAPRAAARLIAAQALAATGARKAMPFLIDAALTDTDATVRRECARTLGRVNYGMAPEDIYQTLTRTTPPKAEKAINALIEIGDPYAADSLLALLRDLQPGDTAGPKNTRKPRLTGPAKTRTADGKTKVSFRHPTARITEPVQTRHPMSRAMENVLARGLRRLLPDADAKTPDEWLRWAEGR